MLPFNILYLPQENSHPELFPYVLIVMSCNCFLQFMLIPLFVGRFRGKTFQKESMSQFEEEHRKFFNFPVSPAGLPDVGTGRYAAKLEYQAWFTFAKV